MKKKMYGLFELEDDTANAILKIDGEPVGTGVCEYTLNHKAGELPVVDIKADVGVSGKKKIHYKGVLCNEKNAVYCPECGFLLGVAMFKEGQMICPICKKAASRK